MGTKTNLKIPEIASLRRSTISRITDIYETVLGFTRIFVNPMQRYKIFWKPANILTFYIVLRLKPIGLQGWCVKFKFVRVCVHK